MDRDVPLEEDRVDIDGPIRESIFYQLRTYYMHSPDIDDLITRITSELDHLQNFKDDRLLVLLGALVVENAVDTVLSSVMPGFKTLRDKRDITFSIRIEILRALRLIPKRLLVCADLVRAVRNDFAHNLAISSFGALPHGKLRAIEDRVSEYNKKAMVGKETAGTFALLVQFTAIALFFYARQVETFNKLLRDEESKLTILGYLESHFPQETK